MTTEQNERHGSKTAPVDLLGALERAGPEQLEEIDDKINALEKQLDALKLVRNLLQVKFHGKPKRSSASVERGLKTKEYRAAAVKYLLHSGSATSGALIDQCEIPRGSITGVLNHEWFIKNADGLVRLTTEGEVEGCKVMAGKNGTDVMSAALDAARADEREKIAEFLLQHYGELGPDIIDEMVYSIRAGDHQKGK